MHSGLLCIAFHLSVSHYTKSHQIIIRQKKCNLTLTVSPPCICQLSRGWVTGVEVTWIKVKLGSQTKAGGLTTTSSYMYFIKHGPALEKLSVEPGILTDYVRTNVHRSRQYWQVYHCILKAYLPHNRNFVGFPGFAHNPLKAIGNTIVQCRSIFKLQIYIMSGFERVKVLYN